MHDDLADRDSAAQHAVIDESGSFGEESLLGDHVVVEHCQGEHQFPMPGNAFRLQRNQVEPFGLVYAERFSELQAKLPGVGAEMLTQTLRRLESASLVDRTVFAEVPPRVEYRLAALGASVAEPLGQLRAWAENHIDRIETLNPRWNH